MYKVDYHMLDLESAETSWISCAPPQLLSCKGAFPVSECVCVCVCVCYDVKAMTHYTHIRHSCMVCMFMCTCKDWTVYMCRQAVVSGLLVEPSL